MNIEKQKFFELMRKVQVMESTVDNHFHDYIDTSGSPVSKIKQKKYIIATKTLEKYLQDVLECLESSQTYFQYYAEFMEKHYESL